jgi:hypothetical protein
MKYVGALAFRESLLGHPRVLQEGRGASATDDPPAELGDMFIHSLVAKPVRTG